jgi:import inner membrane translocase subunit TIM44
VGVHHRTERFAIDRYCASAGASVVVHKLSARQQAWEDMKSTNPVLKKFSELKQAYNESENSFVSSLRTVTDTVGSWFDENETAQVLRAMKNMDPDFNRESFERELREYIVPEVVDAYLSADQEALKEWCGEAVSDLFWSHERITGLT